MISVIVIHEYKLNRLESRVSIFRGMLRRNRPFLEVTCDRG